MSGFPAVSYEERQWQVSSAISRRLGSLESHRLSRPYKAAVVPMISEVETLGQVQREAAEMAELATYETRKFDAEMGSLPVPMPAILLRGESASSSRIENLTAGARQIAAATLGVEAAHNAELIASNVAAMREAISQPGVSGVGTILALHEALLSGSAPSIAGRLREEQVWIGGGSLSPHGADFVPPRYDSVPGLLDDLIKFIHRIDLPPILHAAIAHAQFETIHPFIDGNGRVGRALIHVMLGQSVPIITSTIPVSAGLLANPQGYFKALTAYREGDISPITLRLSEGALVAADNGRELASEIVAIRNTWQERIRARSDSSAWRLADHLFAQPVINAEYAVRSLGVSDRGARNAIDVLVEAEVLGLSRVGTGRKRNMVWQSDDVLGAMDGFARRAGRRAHG